MVVTWSSIVCDGCGACPLLGPRYKDLNCTDADFCHSCVSRGNVDERHILQMLPTYVAGLAQIAALPVPKETLLRRPPYYL